MARKPRAKESRGPAEMPRIQFDVVSKRPSGADALATQALWLLIDEEIERGECPNPRYIAEAFRQDQQVPLPPRVQNYLAAYFDGLRPKMKRSEQRKSKGEKHLAARKLLDRYDELAAQDIACKGRLYGRAKRVFALLAGKDEYGHDVRRQYAAAKKLARRVKTRVKRR